MTLAARTCGPMLALVGCTRLNPAFEECAVEAGESCEASAASHASSDGDELDGTSTSISGGTAGPIPGSTGTSTTQGSDDGVTTWGSGAEAGDVGSGDPPALSVYVFAGPKVTGRISVELLDGFDAARLLCEQKKLELGLVCVAAVPLLAHGSDADFEVLLSKIGVQRHEPVYNPYDELLATDVDAFVDERLLMSLSDAQILDAGIPFWTGLPLHGDGLISCTDWTSEYGLGVVGTPDTSHGWGAVDVLACAPARPFLCACR